MKIPKEFIDWYVSTLKEIHEKENPHLQIAYRAFLKGGTDILKQEDHIKLREDIKAFNKEHNGLK